MKPQEIKHGDIHCFTSCGFNCKADTAKPEAAALYQSKFSRLWERYDEASHDNAEHMRDILEVTLDALEAAEKRIAELEARTLTVRLPEAATEGGKGYRKKAIWVLQESCFDAGINLDTGGEA